MFFIINSYHICVYTIKFTSISFVIFIRYWKYFNRSFYCRSIFLFLVTEKWEQWWWVRSRQRSCSSCTSYNKNVGKNEKRKKILDIGWVRRGCVVKKSEENETFYCQAPRYAQLWLDKRIKPCCSVSSLVRIKMRKDGRKCESTSLL